MGYISLYREWRPQVFRDVVGQEHITRTLQNALRTRKVGHAYLFSGPRGTGKTSTAKILAKAVNCENLNDGEPCNQCTSCVGITKGTVMDVVEIDAASNRGVEEIRDLRDKVKYAPAEVKVKVYIIDEVHMLTPEAFNALLKTLEEPPAHVLFVLATTEPHKLPATIISRCQRFEFRRIQARDVLTRLHEVSNEAGISIDDDALWLVALASDGGMRDALSLLEQVIAFGTGHISADDVNELLGSVSISGLYRWVRYIAGGLTADLLRDLGDILDRGKDPSQVILELLQCCRDMIMVKALPDHPDVVERLKYDKEIKTISDELSQAQLLSLVERLTQLLNEMKWATQPRLLLEVGLLRLCRQPSTVVPSVHEPTQSMGDKNLYQRIEQLEGIVKRLLEQSVEYEGAAEPRAKTQNAVHRTGKTPVQAAGKTSHNVKGKQSAPVPRAGTAELSGVRTNNDTDQLAKLVQNWPTILDEIKRKKITTQAWLLDGELVAVSDGRLYVSFKSKIHREKVMEPEHKTIIDQVISEHVGAPFTIVAVSSQDWETERNITTIPQSDQTNDPVSGLIDMFGHDKVKIIEE